MALAPGFGCLVAGRVVTGLGVGVSFVVVPVYISEITPSEHRGMLSTCFDIRCAPCCRPTSKASAVGGAEAQV